MKTAAHRETRSISHHSHGELCHLQQGPTDTVEQAGTVGWKGNDEVRWHAFQHGLNSKHRETLRVYGDGGLLSMLVNSDVYAPVTARLMLEGRQVSRGNRGMKLMLEALYRLYQEAFWAWVQQRDQTDLRRNDMDKLVRDIQQAFASGDRRESDRLLFKQLESEHIATIQALQREFTAAGRMKWATFAYWDTFMEGVGTLLRLLRAERDGLFELHLIAVYETIPRCRAADRGNYVRYLPGSLNGMVTLQQKQPKFYEYLRDGGFVVRLSSRRFNAVATDQALEQIINPEGRAREVSSGSSCGRAL